jgi:phosphatidylglycerol:prolipoprotein diacylglycerol transferase
MFAYLILAGIERFLVEFVRTNPPVALGLTQQQWISIGLFVIGVVGVWWFARHGRLRPVEQPKKGKAAAGAKVRTAKAAR